MESRITTSTFTQLLSSRAADNTFDVSCIFIWEHEKRLRLFLVNQVSSSRCTILYPTFFLWFSTPLLLSNLCGRTTELAASRPGRKESQVISYHLSITWKESELLLSEFYCLYLFDNLTIAITRQTFQVVLTSQVYQWVSVKHKSGRPLYVIQIDSITNQV